MTEILDREHPEAGWQPPPRDWIDRNRNAPQRVQQDLKASLEPAPVSFIRELMATLACCKHSRAGVSAEWKIRIREYIRLLGHFPRDIWQAEIDEWSLSSKFFPDASELHAMMAPMLAERRRRLERLEAMLRPVVEHRPPAVEIWRAHNAELRDVIGERR